MLKVKEDDKGDPIRPSADFSTEKSQATGEWQDIYKVLKGKKLQLGYSPARLSFGTEGEERMSQTSKNEKNRAINLPKGNIARSSLNRK